MRPLFTLPLAQPLIDALTTSGFACYEELFKKDGELHESAFEIVKDYNCDIKYINGLVQTPSGLSAAVKLKEEELKESIPTFSEALDNILNGGIQLDSLLHVCGPPGSGKTQFALQLCISVQIPSVLGGVDGEAVFIDTESCFSASRLREMAEGAYEHCCKLALCHNLSGCIDNLSVDSMLNNVHYLQVRDHYQLLASVHLLRTLIANNKKVRIIIIDSIAFPFLIMSKTLDRTRIIYSLINQLSSLAESCNIAIVLINHLTTKINKNSKYLLPSLGESLSHRIPQTLLLGKINNVYSAVLTKSPNLPENIAHYKIVKEGIRDVS